MSQFCDPYNLPGSGLESLPRTESQVPLVAAEYLNMSEIYAQRES